MNRRRGLLIPCLFLIVLLLVLCMAQLSRQPYQYRAANEAAASIQARMLAECGMEDFRVKWTHDYDFPPEYPEGATLFTYMEPVNDWQTGTNLGFYRITVDATYTVMPYEFLRVTSEGVVGTADAPRTLFVITGAFDIKPEHRTAAGPNPNLGRWIEWRENPW